jgi:phosphoribosylglycinamide formyltransferase-1
VPKNIVVLLSGRGSNLEAIARACEAERWPARIAAVIANRPDAAGLEVARRLGLRTAVVDHREQPSRDAFDVALAAAIDAFEPDLVALAGFMRVLGTAFVQRYEGRIVNVHPSLLPAFAGLQTHQRAIEAGCHVAGATVHFVTAELDHGPIVAQAAVPVRPGDDAARLAARVLEQEHVIYPRALRWIVEGRVRIEGQRVVQLDGEPQWLMADD